MKIDIDPRDVLLSLIPIGSVGAEIGVHLGEFSSRILKQAEPGRLYLIDPWKVFDSDQYSESWYGEEKSTPETMEERYQRVVRRFAKEIEAGTVKVIRATSSEASAQIADGELDFVYIDGDHTYKGVAADIRDYLPKLKPGGLLMGDDYKLGRWWKGGVVRAFNEAIVSDDMLIELKIGTQIALRKKRNPKK